MAITATHTVLSQPGIGRNMSTMHTMVLAVFTLPDQPAAITRPLSLAIIRRPLTANSRTRTISSAQAGIWPISTNQSSAAVTSILSARGSANLPKSVTKLYFLAIFPSSRSVKLATMKMATATQVAPGKSQYSTTINTGISKIRSMVSLLGKFIIYVLSQGFQGKTIAFTQARRWSHRPWCRSGGHSQSCRERSRCRR